MAKIFFLREGFHQFQKNQQILLLLSKLLTQQQYPSNLTLFASNHQIYHMQHKLCKAALPNFLILETFFETLIYSANILSFILLKLFGPPVTIKEFLFVFYLKLNILELLRNAPLPFSAQNISFMIGLNITPHLISFFFISYRDCKLRYTV